MRPTVPLSVSSQAVLLANKESSVEPSFGLLPPSASSDSPLLSLLGFHVLTRHSTGLWSPDLQNKSLA